MTEAQTNFDRYATPACPEELTAPVLHRVLDYEPLSNHIWGRKGVGSQGDGTAQFLARTEADQLAVIDILARDLALPAYKLTLRPSLKVRKAVIPAAGYGTRMFPATKATKKELFPIIDRDGIAKPAILLIVEEALEAGIEEVVIIVQEDDLDDFRIFFKDQISIENYNKLPRHFQDYARRILEIGRRVCYFVLFFPFIIMILYHGIDFAKDSWATLETSWSTWAPPLFPIKSVIPVTAFLLLIQGISEVIKKVIFLKTGEEI